MRVLVALLFSLQCMAQYSLQDLEFLENERNYQEFFQHAQDIRPIQRGEQWQEMVKSMAHSYLRKHLALDLYRKQVYQTIVQFSAWPTLYRDLEFQQLRAQFGGGYFTRCLQDPSRRTRCLEQIYFYFNQGQKLPQEALEIVELLQRQVPLPPRDSLFRYFKTLLSNPQHGQYCARPVVQSILLAEMQRVAISKFAELKKWAKERISAPCLKQLGRGLLRELHGRDFPRAIAAFDLLYVSGQLTPSSGDFFLTRNYLQRAKKGERLNLSWNTLKSLAKDFERRQRVLLQLKNLDPLPDQLFGTRPSPEKNTLIDHLVQHFPEYLDHYFKSCLHYLQGRGPFPNGNPTVHCRQLMEEARGKNWVDRQKLDRYNASKIPRS